MCRDCSQDTRGASLMVRGNVSIVATENNLSEELRFRVTPELKAQWLAMCAARKISQQDAAMALAEWIVVQDEVIQAMILKQLTASPDLVTMVVHRLRRDSSGG